MAPSGPRTCSPPGNLGGNPRDAHAAQAGAARAGTDLHSPAGVRPKFGHSLEHIVLRKKPPPPGKRLRPAGSPLLLRGPRRRVSGRGGARVRRWRRQRSSRAPPAGDAEPKPIQPAGRERNRRGGRGSPCAGASGTGALRTREPLSLPRGGRSLLSPGAAGTPESPVCPPPSPTP